MIHDVNYSGAAGRHLPGNAWAPRLARTAADAIRELQEWWSLSLSAPFDGDEVSCACYVEPPCGPTVNPKYTVHIDL